jgi:uncharacterized membrane protein YphA (DoxX/SURF4 family)
MNLNEKTLLWPISLSRILIGLLWLWSLRWKLPPHFQPAYGRGLMDWLQLEVQHAAIPLYGTFVQTIVIPNFTLFAWIIFLAELLVALSLISGSLTRLGAAVGLLMSMNLGLGLLDVPGEWPWSYAMMAMWHGTFLVTGAGRLFGLDAWLRKNLAPENSWLRLLT